jgi:type III restriction enzyme
LVDDCECGNGALFNRLSEHGRKQVRKAAELLIAGAASRGLETSDDPALAFTINKPDYAPYHRYSGQFVFAKHAFDLIGHMGKKDEPECAAKIDAHPNVKRWLRNLTQESAGGFSLPLSPGRFYPDFLAELNDGRYAIVEYKGPHIANDPKELHKKAVGELWEARSSGRCVFVRLVGPEWDKLDAALAAVARITVGGPANER